MPDTTIEKIQRLAHWEVYDDLQALRTRLACIGVQVALLEPPADPSETLVSKSVVCDEAAGTYTKTVTTRGQIKMVDAAPTSKRIFSESHHEDRS